MTEDSNIYLTRGKELAANLACVFGMAACGGVCGFVPHIAYLACGGVVLTGITGAGYLALGAAKRDSFLLREGAIAAGGALVAGSIFAGLHHALMQVVTSPSPLIGTKTFAVMCTGALVGAVLGASLGVGMLRHPAPPKPQ